MQTTLYKIKSHQPCGLLQPENTNLGWGKLLNHLGKTEADDEVLELRTILESNGIDDTIWVFRAVDGKDKELRLFAADCAELVLPIYEKKHPSDDRPRKAIQAARDYANGLISAEELVAARAAWDASDAWDAAWDDGDASDARAAWVAWDERAARAAWVAAWDASDARAARAAAWAASDARAAMAASDAWDARAARAAAWAASDARAASAASAEIKSLLLKYI